MLYNKIGHLFAQYLVQESIIDKEDEELYAYGGESVISSVFLIVYLTISSIITRSPTEAFLYYFMFMSIRKYGGGYHAKTYLKCTILYLGTYFVILNIEKIISIMTITEIKKEWEILGLIMIGASIIFLAPVENENNPIEKEDRRKYRDYTIIIAAIEIMIIFVFMVQNVEIYHFMIACLGCITIYMYIGKGEERKWKKRLKQEC